MIPDSETLGRLPLQIYFRDADGCARFPGCQSWAGDNDGLPGDARTIHVPFHLGVVDQFEMAWNYHESDTDLDLETEERELEGIELDPEVGELARSVLERYPVEEIAFEVA